MTIYHFFIMAAVRHIGFVLLVFYHTNNICWSLSLCKIQLQWLAAAISKMYKFLYFVSLAGKFLGGIIQVLYDLDVDCTFLVTSN